MNHKRIKEEEIVERYVLGKLSREEEALFEEHYFSCDQCFEEVQKMETLVYFLDKEAEKENFLLGKEARRHPFFSLGWLKLPALGPAGVTALTILLIILIYPAWQGIVTIPRLKNKIERLSQPQADVRSFSLQQTRAGEGRQIPLIEIGTEERIFLLNFTILEKTIPNPQYDAKILNQEGKQIWKGEDLKGVGEYEIFSIACNTSFFREGFYTLKVFETDPENGSITNEFPFSFRIIRR